jgi:hypothetical protein
VMKSAAILLIETGFTRMVRSARLGSWELEVGS